MSIELYFFKPADIQECNTGHKTSLRFYMLSDPDQSSLPELWWRSVHHVFLLQSLQETLTMTKHKHLFHSACYFWLSSFFVTDTPELVVWFGNATCECMENTPTHVEVSFMEVGGNGTAVWDKPNIPNHISECWNTHTFIYTQLHLDVSFTPMVMSLGMCLPLFSYYSSSGTYFWVLNPQ